VMGLMWDASVAGRWSTVNAVEMRVEARLITRWPFVCDRWWLAVLVSRVWPAVLRRSVI
jgi:hypothetical protein